MEEAVGRISHGCAIPFEASQEMLRETDILIIIRSSESKMVASKSSNISLAVSL